MEIIIFSSVISILNIFRDEQITQFYTESNLKELRKKSFFCADINTI